jgi:zeaxanthin glucosyltransferase
MRLAFFSPPFQGHLFPAAALAEALNQRGHECFAIVHPQTSIPAAGLKPLYLDASGAKWTPDGFIDHSRSPGLPFGIGRLVRDMAAITDSLCRQAPDMLREHGIDGVVSDQMEPAGALVAEHLGLPYVSLAAAAPINREPLVPLPVLPWSYEDSEKAVGRNRAGEYIADWLTQRHDRTIEEWSARFAIAPKHKLVDCLSPLADLSQMTKGLDFPRQHLPSTFHPVGRLRPPAVDTGTELPEFGGGPLIYASFGTLQGHRLGLFRNIARACKTLGVRLIVSHSGALTPKEASTIGADWIFPWVPQQEVLARADVVITHGGLNTVLDSLAEGLPMLCLPLAFEQPGIGARLARSGAGLVLSPKSSVASIAEALRRLVEEPSFRQKAGQLAGELAAAPGSHGAAVIVERALQTRQPVEQSRLAEAAE